MAKTATWEDVSAPLVAERADGLEAKSLSSRLVSWDRRASSRVYYWYQEHLPAGRSVLLFLEYSGHGVPWILWPLLVLLLDRQMSQAELAVLFHFFVGILLDLAAIGFIKPIARRSRPDYNPGQQLGTIHAFDQFSFPSGHTSRAAFILAYVIYADLVRASGVPPFMANPAFISIVLCWAVAIAISRVALGRHHILDVMCGAALGMSYILVLHVFWIPDNYLAGQRSALLSHVVSRLDEARGAAMCAFR